ncbi:MAG: hypothetical protein VKL39_02925 [Leptolyngbyaceae bacterium]|nr:hypothetical protein [Leptolyngbyaceae bacterium]
MPGSVDLVAGIITNVNSFGAHDIFQGDNLNQTIYINTNLFGSHKIEVAARNIGSFNNLAKGLKNASWIEWQHNSLKKR